MREVVSTASLQSPHRTSNPPRQHSAARLPRQQRYHDGSAAVHSASDSCCIGISCLVILTHDPLLQRCVMSGDRPAIVAELTMVAAVAEPDISDMMST